MSKYADVLNKAIVSLGNGEEARAEQILVKELNQMELRFTWWTQDGKRFQRAPLDLPENDWLLLFEEAVNSNVLSQEFIKGLLRILAKGLK
ncbi:MAG: hypothetical protein ACYC21_09535 [Eubacteriales bacterium]